MTLSVLSLNLWNNSGPYAARRERLRDWIDRLDPDLIGFQEALRGEAWDQVAELLEGRKYYLDFVRASDFWGASGLEWKTTSPPPTENFAEVPQVTAEPYTYPAPAAEGSDV